MAWTTLEIVLLAILIVVIGLFVFWLWTVGFLTPEVKIEGFGLPGLNSPVKNPDVPLVRNSKNISIASDLKNPREVESGLKRRMRPIITDHFVLDRRNPLGLNMQESALFRR